VRRLLSTPGQGYSRRPGFPSAPGTEYPLEATIAKIEALSFAQDLTDDLVALLRTGALPA